MVAAYYSKGRYSSSVPVNYCPIRNLKRVPGAKPGFVSLTSYKTIYIDPEEAVINRSVERKRMKTTRYCLTLPYLEVVKKLKYELRWGCIRGTLLSQAEVSPQVTVLLLQVENQLENTMLIIDHLRTETQLRIIEPKDQGWDQILGKLFLSFRLPPKKDIL